MAISKNVKKNNLAEKAVKENAPKSGRRRRATKSKEERLMVQATAAGHRAGVLAERIKATKRESELRVVIKDLRAGQRKAVREGKEWKHKFESHKKRLDAHKAKREQQRERRRQFPNTGYTIVAKGLWEQARAEGRKPKVPEMGKVCAEHWNNMPAAEKLRLKEEYEQKKAALGLVKA